MALFGKKAKDAPSAPPTADDNASGSGGPATLTADDTFGTDDLGADSAATGGKPAKVKAVREPKAPKNKTIKNGVAVGLNIGNQFIKAVEVTSKNGELSVTALGIVPTPPESYSNGNVLSVSALSNAIKDLWRTAGIKSKVVVTSVAGTGALVVRVIEVPKMSDGELRDNMRVDADRYIPFPPSEVVMDFKALRELPSDPDAPNMEVLLAAAQREIIDLHVSVVQKAKLTPRAIDVEPIAAVRSLQLERQSGHQFADYNEVTAVVNIGATGAEISILRGDVLVFTRSVPNGGNAVTQAISDGLGVPFSDAERVKIESADALAPAGYNAGGDEFGFGGGNDFDFGAPAAGNAANFEDFGAAPEAAPSSDPFDLDFFNQAPQQDEPGAGHAQKEDDTPDEAAPFSFGFDFPETTPATPTASASSESTVESTVEPTANSPFDFGFSTEEAAPAASVTPPDTTPAPSISPQVFDFGGADTPTNAPNRGTQPLSEASPTASTQPATSTPPADFALPPAAAYSAFDFDNFDLPSIQAEMAPTPVAPSSVIPAVPSPATAPEPPVVAPVVAVAPVITETASPFTLDKAAVAPTASPTEVPPTIAPSSEFDLDSIFGTPGAAPGAAPTPASSAPVAPADIDDFPSFAATMPIAVTPNPAPTPAAPMASAPNDDDFDLSGIGDDFTAGFGAPGDDFAAFGAGLSASGGLADAATLYNLIYAPLEELSNEVRRSLEFHLGRYPDATISRLVLMGGGAKLRNLDAFLTQMLGVPTAVANPFSHVAVRSAKLPPEYAAENGAICAVALGLALRDFVD